jgi:hypothetical protein
MNNTSIKHFDISVTAPCSQLKRCQSEALTKLSKSFTDQGIQISDLIAAWTSCMVSNRILPHPSPDESTRFHCVPHPETRVTGDVQNDVYPYLFNLRITLLWVGTWNYRRAHWLQRVRLHYDVLFLNINLSLHADCHYSYAAPCWREPSHASACYRGRGRHCIPLQHTVTHKRLVRVC